MPRVLELTWVDSLRQWRKRRKVGGKTKTFYLGTGRGKGDREGYLKALSKWNEIKSRLDEDQTQIAALKLSEKYRQTYAHLPPYQPPAPDTNPNAEEHPRWRGYEQKNTSLKSNSSMAALLVAYLAEHPHQLRHNYATGVRHRHGLEIAQILPGHATADATQIYAQRDLKRAVEIAGQEG